MISLRNPFRIQAAQHAVPDDVFVRLFAPGVLELLPENEMLWQRLILYRSAPGGGKTSLLRLFTPGALTAAYSYRNQDSYKEIVQHLTRLGAIDEAGPDVVAILLSFSHGYGTLDELSQSAPLNERAFTALLNARLMLAILRTVSEKVGITYPDDLHELDIQDTSAPALPIPPASNARALYDWASKIEEAVYEALDSLTSEDMGSIPGHESLFVLNWYAGAAFTYRGSAVRGKRLVMFDEVQTLTSRQRSWLLTHLSDFRRPLGLWIAERFDGLRADDLLSVGARQRRDYEEIIELEHQWRSTNAVKFQKFTSSIADLRAQQATGFEGRSFTPCLASTLDGTVWETRLAETLPQLQDRVTKLANQQTRYNDWIADRSALDGTPHQTAIAWRSLEILIERDKRKSQAVFEFDVLSKEELDQREASTVRAAAEFFLSRELALPYFFGIERLVALASCNIEQFVDLAGDLFEEIVSAAIIKRQPHLDPLRQQQILEQAIETRWQTIPQGSVNGYQVRRLLDAIGAFCASETLQPNAPYAPGVTGVALSMRDRESLVEAGQKTPNSKLGELATTLGACIAHNLLDARLDQRSKGESWFVLYLNRMLCVKFGLPLGFGGYRPKKLIELTSWMDRGAPAASKTRML